MMTIWKGPNPLISSRILSNFILKGPMQPGSRVTHISDSDYWFINWRKNQTNQTLRFRARITSGSMVGFKSGALGGLVQGSQQVTALEEVQVSLQRDVDLAVVTVNRGSGGHCRFCLPPMEDSGVLAGAWYGGFCMCPIMGNEPMRGFMAPWLEPLFSPVAQDAAAWGW
ncbi:hypothetical protein INR49_030652 [Caranx melampygus]|nr:hypothetical protein INR49_030652 [Caranx melampygus]